MTQNNEKTSQKKKTAQQWIKELQTKYPGIIIDQTEEKLGSTLAILAARAPRKPEPKQD